MKVRLLILGIALLGLGSACQSEEDRLREEASRFVELYKSIQYGAPPQQREARLSAIEQSVFVSPEVVGTRTICLSGHRHLIDAQRSQDETAKEIDKALVQSDGGGPMAAGTLERLQGTLSTAQAQLRTSAAELEDCETKVRSLDMRFGKR